ATGCPAGLRRPCDGSQRFRHPPNRCKVETLRRYPERDAWAQAVCQQDSEARRTERTPRRGASEGRGGVMSLSSARIDPVVLPSDADRSGRDLGTEELALLRQVIESGTLNCTKGTQVKAFEAAFAARYRVPHARAVTAGTAAIHAAIAAIDPEPGDEIITSPVTDMGAITPILYQQAIPIFADVDAVSLNVTPESVAARITPRTRAIIATHL